MPKNYNNYSKMKHLVVPDPTDDDLAKAAEKEKLKKTEAAESKEPEYKLGKVVKCGKLRIRKHPNTSAEVVTTVNVNEPIQYYDDKQHSVFYRVKADSGYEGFAMREYIE